MMFVDLILVGHTTVTGYDIKKFMNDISTAEADSRMCWVSIHQKFHAQNEFGTL